MNPNLKTSGKLIIFLKLIKTVFSSILKVCKNIKISFGLMGIFEKITLIFLLIAALLLTAYKFEKQYLGKTQIAPANGGVYHEIIIGEVKTLNPILAQTDAEKSASSLLFSGLIKIDGNGNVQSDLAERYEISQDGRFYTFYLRNNLRFSDGEKLTAEDVLFTVSSIQSPESKSPLNSSWSDVKTSAPDDQTVVFELPKVYGPFVYNCNFGVIPAYLSAEEFSKKLVGSGIFAFKKAESKDGVVSELRLVANENYHSNRPMITEVNFSFLKDKNEADKRYSNEKNINAIFGLSRSIEGNDLGYSSAKKLGLIFNLRSEKVKDKELRKNFVLKNKIEAPVILSLLTLDLELQKQKALEIKNSLKDLNFEIEINALNPIKFQEMIVSRAYDLVLYGFESRHDRDPYVYWHSSQINAMNLAGYSDKNSDILLEDARMSLDSILRNQKYDQFMQTVANEYLATYFEPLSYDFKVRGEIKGVNKIVGSQVNSRYENIASWYIKEKRVGK